MEQHWLIKDHNQDLIIFALGWASDFHAIAHIHPQNYDMLCTDDYRTIEAIDPAEVIGYQRVYLFAWSFGVWASELIFRGISFYKTVALNGTPLPVNNRYGIPSKSFSVTIKGIVHSGIDVFNHRAYGDSYDQIVPWLETRSFEKKYEELCNLFEASTRAHSQSITWNEAVIGLQDVIFPPNNVKAYWEEESPDTEIQLYPNMPHYPYADPTIVLSRLHSEQQPMQSHQYER